MPGIRILEAAAVEVRSLHHLEEMLPRREQAAGEGREAWQEMCHPQRVFVTGRGELTNLSKRQQATLFQSGQHKVLSPLSQRYCS